MKIWGFLSLFGFVVTAGLSVWSFVPSTYDPSVGDALFAILVMGAVVALLAMGLSKLFGFGPVPLADEPRGPIAAVKSVPVRLTLLLATTVVYAAVIWSTTKWSSVRPIVGIPFEITGKDPKNPNQPTVRKLSDEEYIRLCAINGRVGCALIMPLYLLSACFFFARLERRRRRPDDVAAQFQPATVEAADRFNLSQLDRWSSHSRGDSQTDR